MFDHVKFGVSDLAASKAFFLKALAPLGLEIVSEGAPAYGVELCPKGKTSSLCLYQTEEKPAHLHLAFVAETRAEVDAFHRAGLAAGGKDNGAPAFARITTRTTTRPSSSARTDITSRWFATHRAMHRVEMVTELGLPRVNL
jgi:catechol 2,3-dioxygenase-like lactoylglutathione lyase family enzyme